MNNPLRGYFPLLRVWATVGILISLCGCMGIDTRAHPPMAQVAPVTFTYKDAKASSVCISGTFNSWSSKMHCMNKEKEKWVLDVVLNPGRHAYVFVVDRSLWVTDPEALLFEDNGFGGKNSVLIVD